MLWKGACGQAHYLVNMFLQRAHTPSQGIPSWQWQSGLWMQSAFTQIGNDTGRGERAPVLLRHCGGQEAHSSSHHRRRHGRP